MSRFVMDFQCNNDAFSGGNAKEEVARILEHTAKLLRFRDHDEGICKDINGNKVGSWSLDIDEENEDD
jgi:hypothetical protein